MFLFVKYIVEQKEWDRRFRLSYYNKDGEFKH